MVHFKHLSVHFVKVVFNELVDDLLWQIYPDIQDALLLFVFEGILQVFLHVLHYYLSSTEVWSIPLSIGLFILLSLLTYTPVR